MTSPVSYERVDDIGVITIDNPPVNALSHAVRAGIQERIDALAADGPTADELARVKAAQAWRFLSGLEGLQSRAMALGRYETMLGDSDYLERDLARYDAVDAAAVQAAAALLASERAITMEVRPEPPDPSGGDGAEMQGEVTP